MQAGTDASNKDDYNTAFKDIEAKHIEFTRTLIPDSDEALDEIKNLLKSLESLLQGIYLINELSPKTVDKLLAYGEILSSSIIASWYEMLSIGFACFTILGLAVYIPLTSV